MRDPESFLRDVGDHLPFEQAERAEILEELRGHVADSRTDLEAGGLSPEEAERIAVERLGPAEALARNLTDARHSRRRLLAAAGTGTWAVVTSGIYGWIVGLLLAILAWFATVSVVHFVGPFAFDSISFIAIGAAAYAAGSAVTPVVAARAGYGSEKVRRLVAPLGAVLVGAYALVGWSGPLDVVAVVAILSLPAWWILGTLRRTRFRRGSMRAFGALLVVAVALTITAQVAEMRLRNPLTTDASFADIAEAHLDRIAAPMPQAISATLTGSGGTSVSGPAGVGAGSFTLDVSDATLFAGWSGLRIEAWKAVDPGSFSPTPLSPMASGPFVTGPAVWSPPGEMPGGSMTWSSSVPWGPKAMTLSGSVRLDRTPGITAAWVALTGIAPDGVRHLIGDPSYVEATFNGTTLDWLRAVAAPLPGR